MASNLAATTIVMIFSDIIFRAFLFFRLTVLPGKSISDRYRSGGRPRWAWGAIDRRFRRDVPRIVRSAWWS